jgi:AcrR family transcriptional regulator
MKNGVIQNLTRRELEKAELREKILDAARALFAAEGYEAVTMRKIAQRISYTATALYYHFPDKHSIMVELCQRDFSTLANCLLRIGKTADPVERIVKMGLAYVKFGIDHPQHYRLMFMTPQPECESGDCQMEEGDPDQDAYAFLEQSVVEILKAGRFRKEVRDVDLVVQTIWAGVHGIVALHLTKGCDEWLDWRAAEKIARFQLEALFRGLLK